MHNYVIINVHYIYVNPIVSNQIISFKISVTILDIYCLFLIYFQITNDDEKGIEKLHIRRKEKPTKSFKHGWNYFSFFGKKLLLLVKSLSVTLEINH